MQKNRYIKGIIVGIISSITAIFVLSLNLNSWLSFFMIAVIIYVLATIVDKYKK
ncbi:hypothetical protein [Marinilactibacillus psychrotolerans]|uniref:hypothetical protein n=1 Tax=Marinilactibacillus psychrotolerans TaxID=191770 RepID=UPI00388744EA